MTLSETFHDLLDSTGCRVQDWINSLDEEDARIVRLGLDRGWTAYQFSSRLRRHEIAGAPGRTAFESHITGNCSCLD